MTITTKSNNCRRSKEFQGDIPTQLYALLSKININLQL